MKPADDKAHVEYLSDPEGVEFNPSGVELNTLGRLWDGVNRKFHLRLMMLGPFGTPSQRLI